MWRKLYAKKEEEWQKEIEEEREKYQAGDS